MPPSASLPIPRPTSVHRAALCVLALLAGCASRAPEAPAPAAAAPPTPSQVRARIAQLLPASLNDRAGWAADIYAAFAVMQIAPTPQNLCAVLAVAEQESGFRVDPPVPNLGAIAWKEIDARAERVGMPKMLVHGALELRSPGGATYRERIDAARTEQELSRIFEDFVGMVPLGAKLFGNWNPVRTAGPMQVSIAFAEQHVAQRPYPYPVEGSLRHEVFSRRGGLYFGIKHLLGYPADYDKPLYRFADFNAGWHASRNAAFQQALTEATGVPLERDGDLMTATERAAAVLAQRIGLDDAQVKRDLEHANRADFTQTRLYRRVYEYAETRAGKALPRAVVPQIALKGAKIRRPLTTEWFAKRVDARYRTCLAR